jgi:hypothetical protein
VNAVAGDPVKVATNTAFAPRGGVELASMLAAPAPNLETEGTALPSGPVDAPAWPEMPRIATGGGCASCAVVSPGEGAAIGALSAAAAVAALIERRRRRAPRRVA